MTRDEFEAKKLAAHRRLDDEFETAWREKRHCKVRVGADFQMGVPGDVIAELVDRERDPK